MRLHATGARLLGCGAVREDRSSTHEYVFALPAAFAALPGLRRCGCCGGVYPARRARELAATPGVFICRDCARWAARR